MQTVKVLLGVEITDWGELSSCWVRLLGYKKFVCDTWGTSDTLVTLLKV